MAKTMHCSSEVLADFREILHLGYSYILKASTLKGNNERERKKIHSFIKFTLKMAFYFYYNNHNTRQFSRKLSVVYHKKVQKWLI